jgi:hypothetical protein
MCFDILCIGIICVVPRKWQSVVRDVIIPDEDTDILDCKM